MPAAVDLGPPVVAQPHSFVPFPVTEQRCGRICGNRTSSCAAAIAAIICGSLLCGVINDPAVHGVEPSERAIIAPVDNPTDIAFFRDDVEPILQKHCYHCHSHAAGELESGLALDWKSGWLTGGDRGPAILPGDPEHSLLIQAISHTDPDLKMPERRLPDESIAVLTEWVRRGAPDPRVIVPGTKGPDDPAASDWWSLRPLVRPPIPGAGNIHPIDAFLAAKIADAGLEPVGSADARTLVRRLMMDLAGLQPTPEQVAEFAADRRATAWEDLVNRWLASPHYGERWARHWLDTIHFADSHGFEHDVFRPHAWRFRDYVIASFNADKPWGQFIREQLAADVLYPDQPELFPAIGYLGAGTYDHSAAATAPKSYEYLDRDDLVTQTMGAFVSTTAACARCHAHKFDPISQADYFSLQAVFAGIGKGNVAFDRDPQIARQRRHWRAILAAANNRQSDVLLEPAQQELIATAEVGYVDEPTWQPFVPETFVSSDGSLLARQQDGSILAHGTRPERDSVTLTAAIRSPRLTAVRLDVLTDPSLPLTGPGRQDNGNLHLSEVDLQLFLPGSEMGQPLKIRRATADFDQAGWTIQHAIDGQPATAWGIYPEVSRPHAAIFEVEPTGELPSGTRLVVSLKQLHGQGHLIGRCRLSTTGHPTDDLLPIPADIREAFRVPASERTPEQQLTVAAIVLKRRATDELAKLPPAELLYASAAVAENERGVIRIGQPREIRILKRGDLDKPGDLAGPGALSAVRELSARFQLDDPNNEGARRAALANWLADERNPLTWRSIANRVWHYHFGRGLVDTPNDFGRMGSPPSHPELLDWLACELRDHGGSLKHIHRLICTSAAYQRESRAPAQLIARDPENRLLARISRQRLDADSFRDAVLVVSGRLDLTAGGPGMQLFVTSPGAQLTPKVDYTQVNWNLPANCRRSIYRVVWRGIPDPLFEALDFPDLGLLAPTRGFSASPLQSLALLNHHFVLHHAEQLAAQVAARAGTLDEQVRLAVESVWLRPPSADEQGALRRLAEQHGLPAVCRLLLNSSEFLFVD